ncbi:toll/interleukin-1 receptor domain-containing protein [Streptococcus mutans]|nr:toll/interleukin-1 receptor domain-containing protein [Streptococcus mutans]MCB5020847.1 toll/interleukin-1 receptor domain-containing protein [Streptococcus mutans]MCB5083817.1 toll/interleukin-1 receptor domain-containing protein [Streptococcus mutans]MCB5087296.1 toll/interleukin-1 receptor domain-containing protein [Streptococcus mutans]MCB5131235.1 toll/interleukin-1 receptor domain-containing protein [Streptococcus mutans]
MNKVFWSKLFNHEETLPLIFISHNSKNSNYGDIIKALLIGVGLQNHQLIYTSSSTNGIPVGNNIYDFLQKGLSSKPIVLFLLSPEYFSSVVCLNEMGATWVKKNNYFIFFLPGFNQRQQEYLYSCLDKNVKGIYLNGDSRCKNDLKNFVREIIKEYIGICEEERIESEVERCCDKLHKISVIGKQYTAKITKVNNKVHDNIFLELDTLLPTGEEFHKGEKHWLQLYLRNENSNLPDKIEEGMTVTFVPKQITSFERKKYGNLNFRNIYAESGTVEIFR